MSVGYWLVAQTKAQRERWAAENVVQQGYEYYLPYTTAKLKRVGDKERRQVCLFPRYLFVWTDGPWRSLLGTFGITGLIMNGQKPSVLAESVVEQIKMREDSQGLVCLPDAISGSLFKRGDALRINEGSFSGYTGVCAEHSDGERVKILLDFMGQKTKVLIAEDHVELA